VAEGEQAAAGEAANTATTAATSGAQYGSQGGAAGVAAGAGIYAWRESGESVDPPINYALSFERGPVTLGLFFSECPRLFARVTVRDYGRNG